MRIEETLEERVARLCALWLETEKARLSCNIEAALALAFSLLPAGNVIVPFQHAGRLGTSVAGLIEVSGRTCCLAGDADRCDLNEVRPALRDAGSGSALFWCGHHGPEISSYLWECRQAGLPVVALASAIEEAFGAADGHADLIVTSFEGCGIIAGRAKWLDAARRSPMAATTRIAGIQLRAIGPAIECHLKRAHDLGQAAGTGRKAGPMKAFWLESHFDGTLTEAGAWPPCG